MLSCSRMREGNVFSRVCLSTGDPYVTITADALDLIVKEPRDTIGNDIWWLSLQICLNVFP